MRFTHSGGCGFNSLRVCDFLPSSRARIIAALNMIGRSVIALHQVVTEGGAGGAQVVNRHAAHEGAIAGVETGEM